MAGAGEIDPPRNLRKCVGRGCRQLAVGATEVKRNTDAGLDRKLQIAGEDVLHILISCKRPDRCRFPRSDAAQAPRPLAQPAEMRVRGLPLRTPDGAMGASLVAN